jgi:conjugal transfer/entry exclusion protein
MKRWRILLLLGVFLVGAPRQVQAQALVLDAANLVQNVVQALQTILMVANQVLELTPLDEIVLSDSFDSDLDDLGAIIEAAQGLSYDVSSLQAQVTALFHLDTAPNNSRDLQRRLAEIRRVVFDSYVYALRTQTLLRTTLSAIRHLKALVGAIGDYLGNMQGNQSLSQVESTMSETLARLQVQSAAYERAQSVERLTEPLIMESIQRMNEQLLFDWPR